MSYSAEVFEGNMASPQLDQHRRMPGSVFVVSSLNLEEAWRVDAAKTLAPG